MGKLGEGWYTGTLLFPHYFINLNLFQNKNFNNRKSDLKND